MVTSRTTWLGEAGLIVTRPERIDSADDHLITRLVRVKTDDVVSSYAGEGEIVRARALEELRGSVERPGGAKRARYVVGGGVAHPFPLKSSRARSPSRTHSCTSRTHAAYSLNLTPRTIPVRSKRQTATSRQKREGQTSACACSCARAGCSATSLVARHPSG